MNTLRRSWRQQQRRVWPLKGLLVTAALAISAACASSSASPAAKDSPAPSSSIPDGSSAQSITVGGQQRTYRVYRPTSLSAGTPTPLVVMLHGALGTGQQAESSYGWDAEADAGHFVVAYPDGLNRTWAVSDTCCGPPAAKHVDDVAFITRVVSAISASLPVDQKRIYATGISNGGMLAYRLACDTTIFAAIGGDSTTMLSDCPSPAEASLIHIHGTADRTIPYAGGPGKRDNGGTGANPADTSGPPIPTLVSRWRTIDRCAPSSTSTKGEISTSVAECPDNRAVELITITGAGHQWPGQPGPQGRLASRLDPPYQGLDATSTIWNFFAAHPRSR